MWLFFLDDIHGSTLFEPHYDKTNKMICEHSEDSSAQSDQSLHYPHEEAVSPLLPIERLEKTDQNGRRPRLI